MGASTLSSRAIIGSFYEKYEAAQAPWFSKIAMRTDSDQSAEEYKWLGMTPQMREWIGGRQAKGFRENGFTIKNKKFESTLEIALDDIRRDKTGQIKVRVAEMAAAAADLPLTLLTTLLNSGASSICYDGQYFFDTDHSEGSSGAQSNKIQVDISELPVGTDFHGSASDPSVPEMVKAILRSVQQVYGFKDDQGRPMNRGVSNFVVLTPVNLWSAGLSAQTQAFLAKGETNVLQSGKINIDVVAEPLLTATDTFFTLVSGGATTPFIHQVEQELTTSYLGEGSEFEHKNDAHQFGTKVIENVGYGLWQKAISTQLV